MNRGKPQIIFGNKDLSPEKSNYWSINAEYRTDFIAVSLTGFINNIKDMVVRKNIDVDDTNLAQLRAEFPEMNDDEASKLERYSIYRNSDKGNIQGLQVNVSANLFKGGYTLNVNVNGQLQSTTYYSDYEDAPGFGIWNLNTTHSFTGLKWADIEPSIGIDNIFDKTDHRIDSSNRRYALFSPGRMLVVGLKLKFKK